eukprot:CAMPEP_0179419202 /NCGR_PEP_ID=MMETSP0799-20121207/8464_1 /TAXON_ID=46947 /ORGANISM="Geminigera cryophila, Strain CCMP2564" /LENGTH=155 /DNA_ID=CAMNT_0021192641 /DNA_START=27 /DNA_END=494 /DNA_ORIENTATION=+
MVTLFCATSAAQQKRMLVDELAALSWEKSMQTIRDADYMEALERFVRRAIDSGKGLDERDGDGRTALHWAAANGHQDQVAALLKAGADANSACQYVGQTPLYMATRWRRAEAIRELLQHGADPQKADRFGKNAFDAVLAGGEDGSQQMHQLLQGL